MAVGSGDDPGMVVEVVEAVLMAEEGVAAEAVGKSRLKSWNIPNFLAFSCPGPNSWSLVFEEAQKINRVI